jgi:EAL domain-containing protein (putative c-di-GMP-specific phosphodiesterase class I)
MTTRKERNGMLVLQAAIVRAVSVLGDGLGMSALAADVHTSAQWVYWGAEGCSSVQGFYYTQAVPSGELAALRSMQPKQNVSFCHNSARHKSGRALRMEGFLRGMQ